MAKRLAGTPRKLLIDNVPYSVAADADFSESVANFENTLIAGSGAPMISQEAKPDVIEDVVLLVDAGQKERLRNVANSGNIVTFMYQNRAGDKYRSQGTIGIDSNKTKENRLTLSLLPTEPFVASIAS